MSEETLKERLERVRRMQDEDRKLAEKVTKKHTPPEHEPKEYKSQ